MNKREKNRHNKVVNQIHEATTKKELPSVSFNNIGKYLVSKTYLGEELPSTAFDHYITRLIQCGNPRSDSVRHAFIRTLWDFIDTKGSATEREELFNKIYDEILDEGKIDNLLAEIDYKRSKTYDIDAYDAKKLHVFNMVMTNNSFEEKDLPKVGIGELNKRILRAVNSNGYNKTFKTSDIEGITKCYLMKAPFSEIEEKVKELVPTTFPAYYSNMKYQIIGALRNDYTINYIVDEILAIEKRRKEIYENDHIELMDIMKDATRIYQLPKNLSFSTLTSYLCGNSTIVPNDNRFKSEHFKAITQLLLEGKKWEDKEVIYELKRICSLIYPDVPNAFELLFKKLTSLPKTYYLVDEINLALKLQKEFVEAGESNVNVYFVPNPKAPSDAGNFYNVYINRVGHLDLDSILPLDLNSIVAPGTDIDAVEWLVRTKADKTFKKVGGIILYRDEKIGSISIFRPNDGKIGIDKEDKETFDEIKDLQSERDKLIEENNRLREENQKLKEEYDKRLSDRLFINQSIDNLVLSYKMKLLSLQGEIKESISFLDDIGGFVKKLEGPKE